MAQVQFQCMASIASPAVHPLVIIQALDALHRDDADDRARGPGWFDSSWDLAQGLEVREGLPQDANLNEWLTVCLLT